MNEIREDIKAFLDGELSPERSTEVQAAIDSDPALREEVEFMRTLGLEIKRMKPEPAVEGATAAMAAVRKRRRPWWLRLETYAAGALGLLIMAIFFPVFAQSKEAAKRTAALSAEKQAILRAQAGEAAATAPVEPENGVGGVGFGDMGGGGGGAPSRGRAAAGKDSGIAESNTRTPSTSGLVLPNQLLIRTANLAVRVPKAQNALAEAIRIAAAQGGYSSGDNLTVHEGDLPIATVTLRVPVRSFERVREQILALGEMIENSSNSDDVTSQVADVEARLKVMRAEEESYVTMLRAARRVGELLEIKERLSSVRQEIESLDAQRKVLRDQAAFSTINATFIQKATVGEPPAPANWTDDAWTSAVNGLKEVGRFLGQAVIFAFVYSPIWIPVVLVAWWIRRRSLK